MNSKTKKLKVGNESSVIAIILAVLLVVVLGLVGLIVAKDNQGIVTFDGGKVTKAEYKVYYQMFASYLEMYGYTQDQIVEQLAEKAALDKMILTDAKKAGVKLSDEDKEEVDRIFNDESNIESFKTYGFDLDDLREVYYNDYIIQAYLEKIADEVTAEDLTAYITSKYEEGETVDLNEYNTSHILFSFTDDSGATLDDEAKATLRAEAEAVLARALAGEDFAALAQEYSDDTGTAENGGQYTCYMDGYTVDEYADAVATMQSGEVKAQLVESAYGYHIIKLNEKVENGRLNSETEREEYANSLFDEAYMEGKNKVINEKVLDSFVRELDPEAYIENEEDTSTDGTTTVTVD